MSTEKEYEHRDYDGTITTLTFSTWNKVIDYVNKDTVLNATHVVWRGHASQDWLLEPTLDRLIKKSGSTNSEAITSAHLKRFKSASRGRRGANALEIKDDNEWWALGQHYGLATPLLDWTRSPYVAAYFAFASEPDDAQLAKNSPMRVIFGLSSSTVTNATTTILSNHKPGEQLNTVQFYEPNSNENARLVSQGGLFSRSSAGVNIEEWVKTYCKPANSNYAMVKLLVPEAERLNCLRSLNRMNINHASLFPDLYGASKYTNLNLTIENY